VSWNPDELNRRAAFHEAGHAVAAVAVGYRVRELWIDGDYSGHCGDDHSSQETTTPAGVYRMAIVALAGWIADAINAGRPELIDERRREILELICNAAAREIEEEDDEGGDALAVACLLADGRAGDPAELLADANDEAERIVREEWGTIEAVAAELLAAEPGTTPPTALALIG